MFSTTVVTNVEDRKSELPPASNGKGLQLAEGPKALLIRTARAGIPSRNRTQSMSASLRWPGIKVDPGRRAKVIMQNPSRFCGTLHRFLANLPQEFSSIPQWITPTFFQAEPPELKIMLDSAVFSLYFMSVDTIQEASHVLRDAEASLRKLLEQAISEQRYADVAAVAPLADTVAKLWRGVGEPVVPTPSSPPTRRDAVLAPVLKSAKKGYPRFHRDRDKLIKIGWSKKAGSEYEHRAPFNVADALIESIRAKVRDGQKFAATDVIPVLLGGEVVPDYQAYLALKWLHSEGVVTKHGRDRYAVEPGRVGAEGLKPFWSRLPT